MTVRPHAEKLTVENTPKSIEILEQVSLRLAGDSGDGIQLIGSQFTVSTAILGNDLATMPDYPAEIRAPAGSLGGVSGFQINFSSKAIYTPGDIIQVLLAMNASALKVNIGDLEQGGIIIANTDYFAEKNLKLAGYDSNPLEDGSLTKYRVYQVPITSLTREAVEQVGLKPKEAERCKNFFSLGLVYWLYDRPIEPTIKWLDEKFAKHAELHQANELALKAGYDYGRTAETFPVQYRIEPARLEPGTYRQIRGNDAAALGLIAAAHRADKQLSYVSYPITPASEILHELVKRKDIGVKVFQTEDEIAAMCAVIGAAYGGALAATGTSGPGMALKSEAIGLAVMLELPCVIINVQRGGPSTGLPTKSEQADLFQAMMGRHGECPVPVIAAQSSADCFHSVYEAFQVAVKYMTPVIVLSDSYLANSAEPWRIPNIEDLPKIEVNHDIDPATFQPYSRDENLSRPWALPGTPGLAHRIGGLEKQDITGDVSYDPLNHQRMCELRAAKIAKVAESFLEQEVFGDRSGDLLLVSWGSTFGAVRTAVMRAREKDLSVAHVHLRHIYPMPRNLGDILAGFKKVLVPELNLGQLIWFLRSIYLIDAMSFTKIQTKPFTVSELLEKIEQTLKEG
ncbi:MAG: 2-oxoacid:acceptor oxidoreductase subunit alpha [Planctomycetota bacterium]|jgi:2-oxoglutarate ferredoxin oxidoreductase subunit alpha